MGWRGRGGVAALHHIYIYIYIYMCVCVCMYMYVYIYMYVYTHTHYELEPRVSLKNRRRDSARAGGGRLWQMRQKTFHFKVNALL